MLSLADDAACATVSLPMRIWASMLRRILPFSTSTQCFAAGTNQLRAAARSLTLEPRRLVAFGMLPLDWSERSASVLVKSLIQSAASAALRGAGRVSRWQGGGRVLAPPARAGEAGGAERPAGRPGRGRVGGGRFVGGGGRRLGGGRLKEVPPAGHPAAGAPAHAPVGK